VQADESRAIPVALGITVVVYLLVAEAALRVNRSTWSVVSPDSHTVPAVASFRHLLRISCGGCDATWAGEDRCHCASCHPTFDNVRLWDSHRVDEKCVHPRRLDLSATKNGIWLEPPTWRRGVAS